MLPYALQCVPMYVYGPEIIPRDQMAKGWGTPYRRGLRTSRLSASRSPAGSCGGSGSLGKWRFGIRSLRLSACAY
jgi:hypothetical protein